MSDIDKKLRDALKELSKRRTMKNIHSKNFNERMKRLLIKEKGRSQLKQLKVKDIK